MDALWRHAFVVSGLAGRTKGMPGCTWHERHRDRRSGASQDVPSIAAVRIHQRSAEGSRGAVDGTP